MVVARTLASGPYGPQFRVQKIIVRNQDFQCVWRACKWLRLGYSDELKALVAAKELHDDPQRAVILKAALFATDSDVGSVAGELALEEPVVKAFNELFFSVADRKQEPLFRAAVAGGAPGRSTTFRERLFQGRSDSALLRIAHHGTLDEVLEAAGMREISDEKTLIPRQRRRMVKDGEKERHVRPVFGQAPITAATRTMIRLVDNFQPDDEPAATTGALNDPFLETLMGDSAAVNQTLREQQETAEAERQHAEAADLPSNTDPP